MANQKEANILLFIQNRLRKKRLSPVMKFITHIADSYLIWITFVGGLMLHKKTRQVGISALFALLLNIIFSNGILKHLTKRTRPFNAIEELDSLVKKPKDYSFPSAHTGASVGVALGMSKYLPKKISRALKGLAALIGLSRLYVGVHYPTDVLSGAALGILYGKTSAKLTDKLIARKNNA